jgi:glycine cleavage system T protein (aminomethyltransferase)
LNNRSNSRYNARVSDVIRTAFHDVQEARGATFVEEGGWYWSVSFGDPDAEYRAVRDAVGMWDVSPLNKWELRGSDAIEAAQRVHSNDILGLQVGQVRYGAFLDEDGLLVDDGTVFKLADDHVWLMTNGMDREAYLAEATKGLEVTVEYVAESLPNLQIQGPRSRDLLRTITDVDMDALGYFRFIPEPVAVGGVPVWLARTGFSGELGYELFLRPEHATDLWEIVEDAGATPYGVEVIEPLRIETGMIVTDYDYAPHERSPFDLGLDRVVALDATGEFMGKDELREIAADPPNRFKTLRLDGDALPAYGAAVTKAGAEVGVLTSPAISPRFGPIGLAILRADAAHDGGRVEVALEDGSVGATVDVLAIYDPEKRRPRS